MRLPKSVLLKRMAISQEEPDSKLEPQTADEFYDDGVEFEESGDRWFTSDISKGIRFYYRAHNSYKQALKMSPIMADALYNLPRLEFDVYNKYVKDDSIVLDDLTNCADALNDNQPGGLFQNIKSLCQSFESSIEILYQSGKENLISWDFFFNTAMCYFEYIDTLLSDASILNNVSSPDNELIKALQRCIIMFEKTLNLMNNILLNNVDDKSINKDSVSGVCIESYRMISSIYETLYSNELINIFDKFTKEFVEKIDSIVLTLFQEELSNDIIITLKISKLKERASRELDYDLFINKWMSEVELNDILEKQLIEASSIRSYIDKFETVGIDIPQLNKWNILTNLNTKYKDITNKLRSEIDQLIKKQGSKNDLLSNKISLLCSVFIERGDIELERSMLEIDEAIKNREMLRNNCKNLLKNALIYSKKSGGIRESMSGKLTRSKRQREAAMRLCIIEQKPQEDWNKIIGEKYWPIELDALTDIEAYKKFFT